MVNDAARRQGCNKLRFPGRGQLVPGTVGLELRGQAVAAPFGRAFELQLEPRPEEVIIQAKGVKTGIKDVRDLRGVLDREKVGPSAPRRLSHFNVTLPPRRKAIRTSGCLGRSIGASFKLIQASIFSIHGVKRGKRKVAAFPRFGNMNKLIEQTGVTNDRLD